VSVTRETLLNPGLFVPLMQRTRGGAGGASPVGTISQEISGTGDGGGGAVYIVLQDVLMSLGFRALYVPTFIAVIDGLGAAGPVEFQWDNAGNHRIQNAMTQVMTTTRVNARNIAQAQTSGVIIEPNSRLAGGTARIALGAWPTNTSGITYRLQYFFAVYDAEDIEKRGSVSDLLAGVR
jgi:hypothetical protein